MGIEINIHQYIRGYKMKTFSRVNSSFFLHILTNLILKHTKFYCKTKFKINIEIDSCDDNKFQ